MSIERNWEKIDHVIMSPNCLYRYMCVFLKRYSVYKGLFSESQAVTFMTYKISVYFLCWLYQMRCITFVSFSCVVCCCFSESRLITVELVYCGAYVTSLEMAGVSLTVLKLNDTYRRCLSELQMSWSSTHTHFRSLCLSIYLGILKTWLCNLKM